MYPDIAQIKSLVIQSAEQELLPRFQQIEFELKADGSLVTEADLAMQRHLQAALAERWPEYALLGEESTAAEQQRLLQEADSGLWVLDPLDGTSNYAAGLPFFAVSLALLVKGERVLGVVYDPMRRECFAAIKGQGAWLNEARLEKRPLQRTLRQCLAAVDFKRLPPELASRLAAHPPYGSQRSLGSVALEWCWVAAGRFHVYLHGKQALWDYAAGSLILDEVGGYSATLENEPVYVADVRPCSAVAALDERIFRLWQASLSDE